MTQEQVAAALRVNKSTVANWEKGRSHPRTRLAPLMDFLRVHTPTADEPGQPLTVAPDPVRSLSDGALWAEIDERMAEAKRRYYAALQASAATQLPVTEDLPDHLLGEPEPRNARLNQPTGQPTEQGK